MVNSESVTILKGEYEGLKMYEQKVKIIDEAIHSELSSEELMKLQSSQKVFAFLADVKEDIYTEN